MEGNQQIFNLYILNKIQKMNCIMYELFYFDEIDLIYSIII